MQKSLAPLYKLTFLAKDKMIFEGDVSSLTAPGEMGYFQVLAHHAPIIALLKAGHLTFVDGYDQNHSYKISGGVLEVSKDAASLLVDSIV